ncbi:MAG: hypothetical protein ACYC21_04960 [Eubacteriales bacterium]
MLIKLILIVIITAAMFWSLWKPSVGVFVPLVILWGYGWVKGFADISLKTLVIVTIIHIIFQTVAWWLSGRYREANLAFTGAGITGFATGILASMFWGALLGMFLWIGLIGKIIIRPVAFGFKNITRSFLGGLLKAVYGTVMSGIIAFILF